MWVRIKQDHDHWPKPRRMMSFKEGTEQSVTKAIGEALIAKDVAEEIPTPSAEDAKAAKATGKLPEAKATKAK